jgi:hypothetical protein
MAAEEAGNLGLHGMRQQRSRAVAQNLGQWVRKRPWLRQLDDIILGHGVSLLQWRSGGVEHPHDTPPYPFTPSPTSAETFTALYRETICALAARYRLPAVYPFRFFVTAGGLISYGVDLADELRRAASYVDRILQGAKPDELPVQLPTKFELIINLKTAKALARISHTIFA